MVAYKELRQAAREGVVGHIPGVAPGLQVQGKGELAILGIHCNICSGIYCKCVISSACTHAPSPEKLVLSLQKLYFVRSLFLVCRINTQFISARPFSDLPNLSRGMYGFHCCDVQAEG